MHLHRLNREDPLFEQACTLYGSAFPKEERRELADTLRSLENPDYHMDVIMEGETLLGLLFYWERENYLYLEHFATLPHLRNQGTGSKALKLIQEKGIPLILEIEPPVDPLTCRRYGFYQRNGFVMNPYHHIQVKFHREDPEVMLKILSWPEVVSPEIYGDLRAYMDRFVAPAL